MTRTVLLVGLVFFQVGPAMAEEPASNAAALLEKASAAARAGASQKAVDLASAVIEKQPDLAYAYYLRGREHFRLGKIAASVADFDKFVKLRPELESRQWERGISYYYAGEFEKAARQFELYQTYYDNDVENSTWRYLCIARTDGVEKARETMLPIKNDRRVPMMQIYDMFRGKLTPDDVLAAAKAGDPDERTLKRQLFYAHLYIGLFYEAEGKSELAKQHIGKAANDYKIGGYMWDVARIHHRLLTQPHEE